MHEQYMTEALSEAKKAYEEGEVPIGCVIVCDGAVIAREHNTKISDNDSLAHAEMKALRAAQEVLQTKYLYGCTLYVTVEPCAMCAGAMVNARISNLVFGVREPKTGCCGSLYNLVCDERMNHRLTVTEGILKEECEKTMKDFFAERRKKC